MTRATGYPKPPSIRGHAQKVLTDPTGQQPTPAFRFGHPALRLKRIRGDIPLTYDALTDEEPFMILATRGLEHLQVSRADLPLHAIHNGLVNVEQDHTISRGDSSAN
jgi:hypothetical protein